jgi:hypothetical protein
MADAHRTALSDQLRVIADELEALAERVESIDKARDQEGCA